MRKYLVTAQITVSQFDDYSMVKKNERIVKLDIADRDESVEKIAARIAMQIKAAGSA